MIEQDKQILSDKEVYAQPKKEEMKQANCDHRWVPAEFDEQGRTTLMKCVKCDKRNILG